MQTCSYVIAVANECSISSNRLQLYPWSFTYYTFTNEGVESSQCLVGVSGQPRWRQVQMLREMSKEYDAI